MINSSFDPAYQSRHPESKIVVALERISEAFRVLLWQESTSNALSPLQIQILVFLMFHRPVQCKISYLAREFNVSKPTISDSVKLLLERKLLTKQEDLRDKRSFSLSLTTEGESIARNSSLFAGSIETPLSGFSDAQKKQLLNTLLHLIKGLSDEGIISVQRMCLSCRFYSKNRSSHFCKLLHTPLQDQDLRIDCPEHELAS